jgi:Xaa-Pro aminopeptidase
LTKLVNGEPIAGFAQGQFSASYEQRHDWSQLRSKRLDRAWAALAGAPADALLLWKDENVRYVTDLRPQLIAGKSALLNGALLIEGQPPVLFCSGGEADRVRATMPWIEQLHVMPILEERQLIEGFVADVLGPLLMDQGLGRAHVGVDEAPTAFHVAFRDSLPDVVIEDGDTPMQMARRIKLAEELAVLEEATALADAVTAAASAAVREGARECDVAAAGMHTLFRLGGEYAHVMTPFVAAGEHMSPPRRITTDKLIRNGDLVFIDIGACWNGYFGDVARTVACGKPSKRQREIFSAVHAALLEGIALMRPGKTEQDAVAGFRRGAAKYGLEDRFLSLFIGHGCGMGANEPPYVGESLPGAHTFEFQPGMVFAIEPLIWVPGVPGGGGVRLEDMVVITDGDAHVMSRAAYDHQLLIE